MSPRGERKPEREDPAVRARIQAWRRSVNQCRILRSQLLRSRRKRSDSDRVGRPASVRREDDWLPKSLGHPLRSLRLPCVDPHRRYKSTQQPQIYKTSSLPAIGDCSASVRSGAV
ncbi:hypothetical protein TIFTF001_003885 [Ficus carica]|uniref:Uncharacterized protein n=1 Tax=Ficus carica TaxID=3494 RepID=A0AA87ZDS4_FICCA|nr:hypothetical protein TIFTF001_003885 [Ficus carica]